MGQQTFIFEQLQSEECISNEKPLNATDGPNNSGISAAITTESQNGYGSDEVEIEIPGGFENIDSFDNDMSASCPFDSDEYIIAPKLDKWIGLDWDDVSITSDIEQNRNDYL